MSEAPPPAAAQSTEEDILTKYKRLLALARSSLESNQATIAAKDKQINQLTVALEEEKSTVALLRQTHKPKADIDESTPLPRSILRRIDIPGQCIWILVEYEGDGADAWLRFDGEEELDDFIQRLPGAPLTVPPRCLTEAESVAIVSYLLLASLLSAKIKFATRILISYPFVLPFLCLCVFIILGIGGETEGGPHCRGVQKVQGAGGDSEEAEGIRLEDGRTRCHG